MFANALAGLVQDARYGVRVLRREPGFVGVAVLTMALGIGATTMLFSVAYGVLLKPLPWVNSDRLVRITETRAGRTGRVAGTVSNGTFLSWRNQPSTIETSADGSPGPQRSPAAANRHESRSIPSRPASSLF